jgi:Uma2 family endonuclease
MSVVATTSPPSFAMCTAFRRFTVDEYHKMIETGILNDEDKVELLEGCVVEKTPRNPPHDVVVQRLDKRFHRLLPTGWEVRVQSAVHLIESEPEPDITLARGDDYTFATRHPEAADVGMTTEVSDSTLARDRQDKGRIYARARIPGYWIVNLPDQQVEVYTNPTGSDTAASYGQRQDYRAGDMVPVVLDRVQVAQIAVSEILG